jgi:hypothetical protein
MKRSSGILCGAALLVLAAFATAQQPGKPKVDLSGTWSGFTFLGDGSRAEFNLVLEKAGETYSGKITSETGQVPDMAIKNVAFKAPTLTFEIEFPDTSGPRTISIELKYESETLKGSWTDQDANTNIIELARKT